MLIGNDDIITIANISTENNIKRCLYFYLSLLILHALHSIA